MTTPAAADRSSSRTRFFLACAVGGITATAVFAWMVFQGSSDLLRREALAKIYDAQARALLHGTWDVDPRALSFERFSIDGHFYTYFGPWPALLRMPVIAFTDGLDGRLSRLSMLLAFAVFLTFVSRLAWQARTLTRGDGPVATPTLVAAAGFVFVVGCGSTAFFLASRAWVYHETILWGIAWTAASLSFLISYLLQPRTTTLIWTSLTATLALLSRPSLGIGPITALIVLLATRPVPARFTRWLGIPASSSEQPAWRVALSAFAPIALYAVVNYQKFGSPFGVPLDKQDRLASRPDRIAASAAHPSSFSVEYAPTNLLQYLRPDGIRFDRLFPWLKFAAPPRIVGGAPFENIEPSASITTVSLLLVALAILGVVGAIRAPAVGGDAPTPAVLRLPLLAASVSAASIIVFWAQFHRYEGDAVPLLVLAAAAGLFSIPALIAGRGRAVRIAVTATLVALAAWSVWATFALTVVYQRSYSSFQSTAVRAGFVDFQLDVGDHFDLDGPTDVRQGDELPNPPDTEIPVGEGPPLGQFFIVGDCEGLYVSTGRSWEPVEPRGVQTWEVEFGPPRPGEREPLWSTADTAADDTNIIWAQWVDERHVRFDYMWTGAPTLLGEGDELLSVEPGVTYDLDVRLDPSEHVVEIANDGTLFLEQFPRAFDVAEPSRLGRQPDPALGATRFRGTIERESAIPICERIAEEAFGSN